MSWQNIGKKHTHETSIQISELHHNLFSFRKNTGTADNIATLVLDLEKAFELADPTTITSIIVEKGVKGKLLAWTADYLTDRQATVKFLVTLKTLNIFADQINRKASQDPIAIFTDGSVNSKSGYSGAAIHFSSQAEARRLSYDCSILLTELSSINKALSLALSTDHTTIDIYADTFSGIQALNKPPEDNLALITNILFKMKSLQNCGSFVILNWISSDIGIDRIEAADIASSKATHYQRMNYQIPPSCIQLKRIKQNIHLTARNLQVVWVG